MCCYALWLLTGSPLFALSFLLAEHLSIESQVFAEGPCLKRAAARGVRGIAVGDFREVVETGFLEVAFQRREKALPGLLLHFGCTAVLLDPGFDKSTDEPRPDGASVIGSIAFTDTALKASVITRIDG